jgi:hypothetical protein
MGGILAKKEGLRTMLGVGRKRGLNFVRLVEGGLEFTDVGVLDPTLTKFRHLIGPTCLKNQGEFLGMQPQNAFLT